MNNARLLYFGDWTLANGFRLAGFEVFPDADTQTLERALTELRASRQPAFVVLDNELSECDCPVLEEVRREGGRILLAQVPPINDPDGIAPSIDQHLGYLLGTREELT